MHRTPWLTLVIVLLIGDQLHAMSESIGNVDMSHSKVITAYLLRKSPIHLHLLEILLLKNNAGKWSGIQTTHDAQDGGGILVAGLEHLRNEGIADIRGAVLVNMLDSLEHGKKYLVRLSRKHQMIKISDTQCWFPVDKLPESDSIPEKDSLCLATKQLVDWRNNRVEMDANDPFRFFDQ